MKADDALRYHDGEMLAKWNYPPEAGALCVCGHALQLHGYYPRHCHYCACTQFNNAEPHTPPRCARKPAHLRPLTKQAMRESLQVRAGDIQTSQWRWLLALVPWAVLAVLALAAEGGR